MFLTLLAPSAAYRAWFVGLIPANFFAVPYYGTQFFTYDMLKVKPFWSGSQD